MESIPVPNVGALRLPRADDVKPLFELIQANRSHLVEWQRWIDQLHSLAHVQYFIDTNRRDAQSFEKAEESDEVRSTHPGFQLLLVDPDGEILGMVGYQGLHLLNRICSLGYWLGEEYQGRGLVTQACQTLVNYSFNTLHFNRIEIQCSVDNKPSQGIPERLGFTKEACLKQIEYKEQEKRFVDHYLYRLLKDDWLQN
jgi:ribosomal-protein-serine acetyltransferase